MNVCILSVTRVGEYFSIAGISTQGEWVRPISDGPTAPFWDDTHLRFDTGFGFIRHGDIIEFQGKKPEEHQHIYSEDYIVVSGGMTLKKRLSNANLLWFLEEVVESQTEFEDTVNKRGRSLCIVKADRMVPYLSEDSGVIPVPKMALTNFDYHLLNPAINASNFAVTDIKWNKLIQQDLIGNRVNYNELYIVIGLEPSSDQLGVDEPHIIGVLTDPEIDLPNSYPY
ncbi:dual OB domain-containing protein [Lentibacillus sp. Marseille-P4043]|uniref:dual OB domain-containing protein n=1 Tax=Lentibacillus sp. Marseille-P4043 TaxID=2040293 RepID=UPI000D0B29EB|nr:hypothetical protein [Lentibacillus sp. Marseille-P4043]